jgi:hypothetical protein
MPFTVKPDGSIVCDTMHEALALADAIQHRKMGSATAKAEHHHNGNGRILDGLVPRTPFVPKSAAPLIKMLEAISAAPEDGIAAQELAEHLGLTHSKGLGGYQAMANSKLREIGYEASNVFQRTYNSEGKSFWEAGPMIKDAIATLKATVAQKVDIIES